MRTIYKIHLQEDSSRRCVATVPRGAEFLSVQTQYDGVSMWYIVDSDSTPEEKRFLIIDTGQILPSGSLKFLGTVQLHGGTVVHHIFEVL